MSQPVRVVIPIDSDDPQAWAYSAAYAEKIGSQASPAVSRVILLTHTKDQLRRTSLASHLGERAAKLLLGNQAVPLTPGKQLQHQTLQTLRGQARGTVVIAYYAEDRMLEVIDGFDSVIGVVAVPDVPEQIEAWVTRWNPIVHGQQPARATVLIDDPVVEKALTSLSKMINLGHGILHPRDKEYANETLRILRANGHSLPVEEIKSWAIRNGWKPGAADELATLAKRIAALRTKPSLTGFHDPQGRYDRWND